MNDLKGTILKLFIDRYGEPETSVFAPGRANIIGEHTDYNNGFVMPFAIGQGVWFFASLNNESAINITAFDTGESVNLLPGATHEVVYNWEKYFRQVIGTLDQSQISGANIIFGGNLPIGAGISSSSAITCGFLATLNELFGWKLSADILVKKAVEAEVGYGVRGGIMDQYTIFNAIRNHAILLDCKTNSHTFIDLDMGDFRFYLINTRVKHNLIRTDYNNRRAECEEAVAIISERYKKIESLREVQVSDLPEIQPLLESKLFNRVSFVVLENARVLKARRAIEEKNFPWLGELLYESHVGLSQMYNVSCDELDWLVDYTFDIDQFCGARMMGGGFGGCTINLIKGTLSDYIISDISLKYKLKFGIEPEIIQISSHNGIIYVYKDSRFF